MVSIRAIYRDGHLQLLEPVDLNEGQEVQLHIMLDERSRVRQALSDVLAPSTHEQNDSLLAIDEIALQQQIDEATRGISVSDVIIEERQSDR
jgi:predicted DNA-binding antitoxin AbrB/MazE fold protein